MTPSELADVLGDNPFPLRLYLAGGTTVHLDDPARATIHGTLLYVNATPGRSLATADRSKVVSIHSIAMIEPRTPLGG